MRYMAMTFINPNMADAPSPMSSGSHRGGNQSGLREFNERLILQVIRRANSISKAEIARKTGLTAQTVSVIVNRLLDEGLLRKERRRRVSGKVGQPAVPIALNPDGAYSIGVKIGRRSLDVLLVDFVGEVLDHVSERYAFPDPDYVFPRVGERVAHAMAALDSAQQRRMVGIGVAAPYGIGGWQQELSSPPDVLTKWGGIDIRQRIADDQEIPIWFENDATAACMADLILHDENARFDNYLYIFIGTFIGGGIVLDGLLHRGPFGFAGSVGSMPVPSSYDPKTTDSARPTVQLIRCASRYLLDERLRDCGLDPESAVPLSSSGTWEEPPLEAHDALAEWIGTTAASIAVAICAASSIVDFEGIVVDGALPQPVVTELTERIDDELDRLNFSGLVRPGLVAGTIGNAARALGGAILPLYSCFTPNKEVLLKF